MKLFAGNTQTNFIQIIIICTSARESCLAICAVWIFFEIGNEIVDMMMWCSSIETNAYCPWNTTHFCQSYTSFQSYNQQVWFFLIEYIVINQSNVNQRIIKIVLIRLWIQFEWKCCISLWVEDRNITAIAIITIEISFNELSTLTKNTRFRTLKHSYHSNSMP